MRLCGVSGAIALQEPAEQVNRRRWGGGGGGGGLAKHFTWNVSFLPGADIAGISLNLSLTAAGNSLSSRKVTGLASSPK